MKIELVEDQEDTDKKRFYTTEEAGDILHLSRTGIWRIRERREINFYKFGDKVLFDMDQIEDYIQRSRVQNVAV